MSDQKRSFPGALTAVAALITAVVGAIPVIMAVRGNNDGGTPSSAASPTPSISPSATPSASPYDASSDDPSAGASAAVVLPSPARLDFGKVVPGLSTPTRSVEFVNTDEQPARLGQARIVGPGAAAFAVANSGCDGRELAPDASCSVQVRFVPAVAGALAGTLVIDREQGDPLQVPLSGTASLL
jgi:hypothetical protein